MKFILNLISRYILPYLKAHVAGLGAGVAVLAAETNNTAANLGTLTLNQWLAALAATGVLGVFTGFVGNRSAPAVLDPIVPVLDEVSQDSGDVVDAVVAPIVPAV